jgi:hypothetical protein
VYNVAVRGWTTNRGETRRKEKAGDAKCNGWKKVDRRWMVVE